MKSSAADYLRFLAGDENALIAIVTAYADGLILYLNTYVQDLQVAEELAEETFVKLVLKRPQIRKEDAFKSWLYTIAGNVAKDYLRKHRKMDISLEDCAEISDGEALENAYIRNEDKRLLHKTMGKLKREYRQILWLIYFEGFSHREAALVLGKTAHNTEVLASRARKTLRDKLLEEGYVYEGL